MVNLKMFLTKYKNAIIAVILVWAFIAFINYFAISPFRKESKELKREIKLIKKENELLEKELKKDSILLLQKSILIEQYEKDEQRYKDLKPLIQIKYEKAKTDYISRSVSERRDVFSKLANEK